MKRIEHLCTMHRSMQVLLLFEMATLPVTFTICPRPAKVMKGKSHDDHPPSTTALPHVESTHLLPLHCRYHCIALPLHFRYHCIARRNRCFVATTALHVEPAALLLPLHCTATAFLLPLHCTATTALHYHCIARRNHCIARRNHCNAQALH